MKIILIIVSVICFIWASMSFLFTAKLILDGKMLLAVIDFLVLGFLPAILGVYCFKTAIKK